MRHLSPSTLALPLNAEEIAIDVGKASDTMHHNAVPGDVATVDVLDKAIPGAGPITAAYGHLHGQRVAAWGVDESVPQAHAQDTRAAIGSEALRGAAVAHAKATTTAASSVTSNPHRARRRKAPRSHWLHSPSPHADPIRRTND